MDENFNYDKLIKDVRIYLSSEFFEWYRKDPENLRIVFKEVQEMSPSSFIKKWNTSKIVVAGLMMVVISSRQKQGLGDVDLKLLNRISLVATELEMYEQVTSDDWDLHIDVQAVVQHKIGKTWTPPLSLKRHIMKTYKGKKKITHVMNRPLLRSQLQEIINTVNEDIQVVMIDWFRLEATASITPEMAAEIKQWASKENVILTLFKKDDRYKIDVFVQDYSMYMNIKSDQSLIRLSNGAIQLQGLSKWKLCTKCGVTHSGGHSHTGEIRSGM